MKREIRIGTRDSKLALWQAEKVKSALEANGHACTLVPLKSPGDIDLNTPLHQFGSTGIFTKILDDALFADQVDIAVHSLKDYPTESPTGLVIAAVLERGPHHDILVHKGDLSFMDEKKEGLIATGSIRRIAQWKHRFPRHQTENLRGNVQTRLHKLNKSNWQGAIFAKAGLERVGLLPEKHIVLDWMIPAPAQGIVGIGCRENDESILEALAKINHAPTMAVAKIERDFLNEVEGGCSAPVGAYARQEGDNILLEAGVFALDGRHKVVVSHSAPRSIAGELGRKAARQALEEGAREIMQNIKDA